jgi:hypothetical protein
MLDSFVLPCRCHILFKRSLEKAIALFPLPLPPFPPASLGLAFPHIARRHGE